MKRAKQTIGLFLFYLLSVSVSNAVGVPSLASYPSAGHTGDSVTVTGSGFGANFVVNVWFDQDFDSQMYGDGCGRFGYTPCEPYVTVTTNSYGAFTTSLIVPPGKAGDFLGAGHYQIAAGYPPHVGPGWLAVKTTPFHVPAYVTVTRWNDPLRGSMVGLSASKFVPYVRQPGAYGSSFWSRAQGMVWLDYNGDYTYNQGEPKTDVWVMPDGTLSACDTDLCGISIVEGVAHYGSFNVLVDIYDYPADYYRSGEQKVEASYYVPSLMMMR